LEARGILSLAAKYNLKICAATSAFVGTGAFVFPLSTSWFLLLILAAFISGLVVFKNSASRFLWVVAGGGVSLLALSGILSAPLAISVLAASVLFTPTVGRPGLAIAILLMQVSSIATLQELLSDWLFYINLETVAPAIVAIVCLLAARPRAILPLIVTLVLVFIASWGAFTLPLSPNLTFVATGIPSVGLAILFSLKNDAYDTRLITVLLFLLLSISVWGWTLPKSHDDIYVLLPDAPEAYESKFFTNYIDALQFSGIDAKTVVRLEDVPRGSLLLLPWLTAQLHQEEKIGALARERGWTVLLGGEHTNLGKVTERVTQIVGYSALRQDLTTPPGNTDISGHLRSADLRAWPFGAILNRGASVTARNITNKILLAGDGWWAEPDIGEWLWAGDYLWQQTDRRGRLSLAITVEDRGARFVVVGDNSLLMSRQIVADPRPVIRLLEMASLWPVFLSDMLILFLGFGVSSRRFSKVNSVSEVTALGLLLGIFTLMMTVSASPSKKWRAIYLGESGFDERNFNAAIVEEPRLWKSGWNFHRVKIPASGNISLEEKNEIIFQLIDGTASIGGVKLYNCQRLGSLYADGSPALMDAQACAVEGDAHVLLGNREAAAIVAVENGAHMAILVLDIAFLSQNAPIYNREWLLEQVMALSN
jgi:hypothetical protein